MSFAFIVYFISVVSSVGLWLTVASFFLFVFYIARFLFIARYNSGNEYRILGKKHHIKWPLITAVVFAVIAALIPSKNDAYLIAGAYAAEKVYDSDIGQDTLKLIHAKIKQQLEEMQQPKK